MIFGTLDFMKRISILPVLLAIGIRSFVSAEESETLRFARILNNNVVLQQGKPITVWGWGKLGTQVEVTITQDVATGK